MLIFLKIFHNHWDDMQETGGCPPVFKTVSLPVLPTLLQCGQDGVSISIRIRRRRVQGKVGKFSGRKAAPAITAREQPCRSGVFELRSAAMVWKEDPNAAVTPTSTAHPFEPLCAPTNLRSWEGERERLGRSEEEVWHVGFTDFLKRKC